MKADVVISYFKSDLELLKLGKEMRDTVGPIFDKILNTRSKKVFLKSVEKFKWDYLLKLEDYFTLFESLYRNENKRKVEIIESKLFPAYQLMQIVNAKAISNHNINESQFGPGDFDTFSDYIHKNTNPILHSYIRKQSNESIKKILHTLPDALKLNVTIIDSFIRRFMSLSKKILFVINCADNYK